MGGLAMVFPLVFYQLVLVALVWLCLMLHWAWPSDPAAVCPTAPEPTPPVPKRNREITPFAGLTTKPHCGRLCARERPPPRGTPHPATAHRAHARPPAPGGHIVALLPPSALCLSGLGGAGQYPCQWSSQWWTVAPAALHEL